MFTDYRDEAASLAADLVNTVGSITGTDYLGDVSALRAFLDRHGVTYGALREGDLRAVGGVRELLRRAFLAPSDDATADVLNRLLARAGARPQVTTHGGRWHLHYVDEEAPVADRLAAVCSLGLVSVIADLGRARLGVCHAVDCKDVFVDTSRNRSRRYCTDTCSTRMNVAAYRARRQARRSD